MLYSVTALNHWEGQMTRFVVTVIGVVSLALSLGSLVVASNGATVETSPVSFELSSDDMFEPAQRDRD